MTSCHTLLAAFRTGPLVLAAFTLISTSACSSSPAAPSLAEGGSPASLSIDLRASAFGDVRSLIVSFTDVAVRRQEGDWISLSFGSSATRTCDLVKLIAAPGTLSVGSIPAGPYSAIRVKVSSATLFFDKVSLGPACAPAIDAPAGERVTLLVPTAPVTVEHLFTVAPSGAALTLSVDAARSITKTDNRFEAGNGDAMFQWPPRPTGQYSLAPVIRVM